MVNPMDKTDERSISQGGSMRSVHIFKTLWGDKISNVKGDACNPWHFSPSIDRVMIGGCPKEGRLMEGLCQGHSSLDAPSELNPPQRIPSPLLPHY